MAASTRQRDRTLGVGVVTPRGRIDVTGIRRLMQRRLGHQIERRDRLVISLADGPPGGKELVAELAAVEIDHQPEQ